MRNKHPDNKSTGKKSRKQSSQYDFKEENFRTPRPKSAHSATFDVTKSAIYSNLKNHPDECLCKDCICGRHLCKFDTPALSMSLASTYKLHYPPRTPYKHRQPPRPASAKLP